MLIKIITRTFLLWNLSMASDSEKSSNNHNLDGSLKKSKKQGNSVNIGKQLSVLSILLIQCL